MHYTMHSPARRRGWETLTLDPQPKPNPMHGLEGHRSATYIFTAAACSVIVFCLQYLYFEVDNFRKRNECMSGGVGQLINV